jgi:hypothetical protein
VVLTITSTNPSGAKAATFGVIAGMMNMPRLTLRPTSVTTARYLAHCGDQDWS